MVRILENWKKVKNLPFEVSSEGRIRTIPHTKPMPNGGVRTYGGKAWRGAWDKKEGRYIIQRAGKTYKVARLVCETWNGKPPEDKPYCLHMDEDATNNRPYNLKWGTQKENLNAPGFIRYCQSRTGSDNPRVKATL